jgi:hypothetical protein
MKKQRHTYFLNLFLFLAAVGCTRETQGSRLMQSFSALSCEQLLVTQKNVAVSDERFQKTYLEPLEFLVADLREASHPIPTLNRCYREHLGLLLASKSAEQATDRFSLEQKLQLSKAIALVAEAITASNGQKLPISLVNILTNERSYENFVRQSISLQLNAFHELLQRVPQFSELPNLIKLSHHINDFGELSINDPYSGIKALVTRNNVTSSPNAQAAMLRIVTLTLVRNGFLFTERGRLQGLRQLEYFIKSIEENLRSLPENSEEALKAAKMLTLYKEKRQTALTSTHSFARLESELQAAYVELGVPNATQLVTDALAEAKLAVQEGLPYGVSKLQEGDIWLQTSEGGIGDMLSSLAGTPNAFTHSGFIASDVTEGYRTYFKAEISSEITFSNIRFDHHVLVRPKFKVEPGFTAMALSNAAKLPGIYFDSMFTPGFVTSNGSALLYCSELVHYVYKNRLDQNGPHFESPLDSLSNKLVWKSPVLEENVRKLGYATQADFYTPDNLFYSPTTQFIAAYFNTSKQKSSDKMAYTNKLLDLFDAELFRLMQTQPLKKANPLEKGAIDVALAGVGFANRIGSLRNMLPGEITTVINSLNLDNDSRHTLLKVFFIIQQQGQLISEIVEKSDFTDLQWKEKAKARVENEAIPNLRALFE